MEVFIENNNNYYSSLTKYSCEPISRPRELYCICTKNTNLKINKNNDKWRLFLL